MPGTDGIAATREILAGQPDAKVVMITSSEDEELGLLSLRMGACGFLSKTVNIESIPRALRAASEGEAVISRRLTTRLVDTVRRTREDGAGIRPVRSPLTAREWEVLDLLCQGQSTDEIADDPRAVLRDRPLAHQEHPAQAARAARAARRRDGAGAARRDPRGPRRGRLSRGYAAAAGSSVGGEVAPQRVAPVRQRREPGRLGAGAREDAVQRPGGAAAAGRDRLDRDVDPGLLHDRRGELVPRARAGVREVQQAADAAVGGLDERRGEVARGRRA